MQFAQLKRRELITLLGGAAAAWPFAARAQEPGRTYRLGFLIPSPRDSAPALALFDELRLHADPNARKSARRCEARGRAISRLNAPKSLSTPMPQVSVGLKTRPPVSGASLSKRWRGRQLSILIMNWTLEIGCRVIGSCATPLSSIPPGRHGQGRGALLASTASGGRAWQSCNFVGSNMQ
jgi:hypothetical protein